MTYAKTTLIALVLACSGGLYAAPALAVEGACPEWKAKRDVLAAKAKLRRAENDLRKARRVLAATRTYSARFGTSVGRWTRLSRRVGWPWSQLDTLMFVIDRESNGDPNVANYQGSGATGLLQLMPIHWAGKFDPRDPRKNLAYGYKLYRSSGWTPWGF